MEHGLIKAILSEGKINAAYIVQGWIRTRRDSKEITFVEINDGSCLANLQLVLQTDELKNFSAIESGLNTGAAVEARGLLIESPAKRAESRTKG